MKLQDLIKDSEHDETHVKSNWQSSQVASPLFHGNVTAMDRWIALKMMDVVGNPPVVLKLWDGVEISPPCENPIATITYYDRKAMLKTIINPELHWGDLYCTGRLEFEGDLAGFMQIIYTNLRKKGNGSLPARANKWLGHRRISNTRKKAEENIHYHYDIGNDFYRLWLDTEAMQYTCAYYPKPGMSLEEAQIAKMHHVCRKLQLRPGDTVVEAGCGWGGLARFMARHYGVRVTAYNISKQQVDYARKQTQQEGLEDRVKYVLDDYRNISGEYDVFVSVGMLEHVGKANYPVLGKIINRCLKPEGRGLIHTIGRKTERPMNGWIERRIFPGAYPPTLREMLTVFETGDLAIHDIENLRLHYAKTLHHWLERFEDHKDEITNMMDEAFLKAWRLYLEGSIAAFKVGELQLYQLVFTHNDNNEIPWSREHIYSSKSNLSLVADE
ncbi:MAG TPA: class I SAM-dependent methyltransferase [Chromatiales bacterium]|nr:class I SAM-dependent methyltransferase [Chromatiales bacterium]